MKTIRFLFVALSCVFLLSSCSDKVIDKVFTFQLNASMEVYASMKFCSNGKVLISIYKPYLKRKYLFGTKGLWVETYTKEGDKYIFNWLDEPCTCTYVDGLMDISWKGKSFEARKDDEYLELKKTNELIGKKYTYKREENKPDDQYLFIDENTVLYVSYGRNDGIGYVESREYEIDGNELFLDGYVYDIEKKRLRANIHGVTVILREKGEINDADIAEILIGVYESESNGNYKVFGKFFIEGCLQE